MAFIGPSEPVFSQEMGPLQTFGADGRLYSKGADDSYLLSRQSYATEDSSGYEGQLRIVKKYPNGGYEVKVMDYIARCIAPFDNIVQVTVRESGTEEYGDSVAVNNPNRFPEMAKKGAYNLYWAACHLQFLKFK